MEVAGVGGGEANVLLWFGMLAVLLAAAAAGEVSPPVAGGGDVAQKVILEGERMANGLLDMTRSAAPGPAAMAPEAKFPLVLAANRTRRPDVLNHFRLYRGGWDVSNKHYWASVAFTGAVGFLLASVWFAFFGLALGAHLCCRGRMGAKDKDSFCSGRISLILLLVFTCAASTGCILLSVGQNEFHAKILDTLRFAVNQSDFTVQILRNTTDFLSFAKTINVVQLYLPSDMQNGIDKLNADLNDAANTISTKTNEGSGRIREVINDVRSTLIVVASLMLLLAILGFLLSILRHRHAIYIFIVSGWLLVTVTFILFGVFLILDNAATDTCMAMYEWAHYPQAETALSNILPCVDEQTTNHTLYQSKEVVLQLVNTVNTAIFSIANAASQDETSYFYNQSGPLMPYLCAPYDSELRYQQCQPQAASIFDASSVWQNYTCTVSAYGSCISAGRVTPLIYSQLVDAVNVSYALYHYTPLLLSLQDCKFVRETFDSISTLYCPSLEHELRMVSAGLALISIGVLLCLVLWIFYANRPQREEVFAPGVWK